MLRRKVNGQYVVHYLVKPDYDNTTVVDESLRGQYRQRKVRFEVNFGAHKERRAFSLCLLSILDFSGAVFMFRSEKPQAFGAENGHWVQIAWLK